MAKNWYKGSRYVVYSLILALLVPSVFARTGVGILDQGITSISNLFNIRILSQNALVQEGFLKFMIFIVTFALANYGLNNTKIFDKKTAGIVAFAFSMIGVFMMPVTWLQVTGGTIAAIMSAMVFMGLFWGLSYVAMFKLRAKPDESGGWVKNLMGLMLLLLLIFTLDVWARHTGLRIETATPIILMLSSNWINKIFK